MKRIVLWGGMVTVCLLAGCDDETASPKADARVDTAVGRDARVDSTPSDSLVVDHALPDGAVTDTVVAEDGMDGALEGGGDMTEDGAAADDADADSGDGAVGDALTDGSSEGSAGDATDDSDALADGNAGDAAGDGLSDSVTDAGYLDESKDLTGLLPYTGQVSPSGFSYYTVTGVTADTVYTISLQRIDGLAFLQVPNANGNGSNACGWDNTTVGETILCAMRASGTGELAFQARGDALVGGTFALQITAGGQVNEGSSQNPVDISSYPFDGACLYQSYYRLISLTPSTSYQIAFTANSAPVSLIIYPDTTYQSKSPKCVALPGSSCTVQPDASGYIYLMTNSQAGASVGLTYTISVTAL